MKNKISSSVVIGIILVIIALGYIGEAFEVWDFELFFPGWWTLFIIVPAGVELLMNGFKRGRVIWLAIGVALLVWRLGIVPEWLTKLFVPILLLAFGFCILFRGPLSGIDGGSYFAIFGGRVPSFKGKQFTGACATAVFGGVDLKLAEATIVDGAIIDALAVFGGVDVKLPPNVNVEITGLPIFGGIGDPKNRTHDDSYPTLRVRAIAIFGGVDVK